MVEEDDPFCRPKPWANHHPLMQGVGLGIVLVALTSTSTQSSLQGLHMPIKNM